MKRVFCLTKYHWLFLFLVMAFCAGAGAWLSFDLLRLAMGNLTFINRYGTLALVEGGALQLATLIIKGIAITALYLVFKGIEVELIHRWLAYDKRTMND